ncbi:uncharacterized protein LOC134208073 [Armigeres subalbatus]|uniref:uncharacterized protein LOC134208073 n=1 Tax=Armigeres subalbatus TaxID=124917 RepID=UPI002ECFFD61
MHLYSISAHKIMKLRKRIYYLKKVSNEFAHHNDNPVTPQIEYLQRDLEILTETLPTKKDHTTGTATDGDSDSVPGFEFPLAEQDEIERLEAEVKNDPYVRCQYVKYLMKIKPRPMNLVQFLPMVFCDEALISYNYHGAHASGKTRFSMKVYCIFTDCFLEAFEEDGFDKHMLGNQLTMAIKQSRNRMRQRTYRAKKTLKRISSKGTD